MCRRLPPPAEDQCQLYDLRADPGETRDVSGSLASLIERRRLARTLDAWSTTLAATAGERPSPNGGISPEAAESLRALGYVGAPAPPGGAAR